MRDRVSLDRASVTSPSTVVSEHDAIMEAIRVRDVEGAQAALAEQLERAHDQVIAQISRG